MEEHPPVGMQAVPPLAQQPDVVAIVDEGLGNSSYLVDLGDGRALAIDPSRDPSPYLARVDHRRD